MDETKLVSVVTATYNMGKYLPFAIESALNQTYRNIEVIVIDDGSTDNTREVVESYWKDPRIRYIHQENKGVANAKNRGIQESRGEFIAFLDADDVWKPNKLDKQLKLFNKSEKIGVVYSDVEYIDENGNIIKREPYKKYYSGTITKQLFIDNFVNFSSAVVKRKCFVLCGMFDETLPISVDWDLWLRISTEYEFAFLNERTFYYRIWSGQMSHNYEKRYKCILRIMEKFSQEYSEYLSKDVVKLAWAHTYFNRGWKEKEMAHRRGEALKYYLKALKAKITFVPAWKGLVKAMVPFEI